MNPKTSDARNRPGNESGKASAWDQAEFMHKLTPEEESKIIAGISAMFSPLPVENTPDEFDTFGMTKRP